MPDLLSSIQALFRTTKEFRTTGSLGDYAFTEAHISSVEYSEVYPQVRISTKLGESLVKAFSLSRVRICYFHYSIQKQHQKDALDRRVTNSLLSHRNCVHLSGVVGTSATSHHPIFGKIFPSDRIYRLADLILIVRRPAASIPAGVGEEWTYWLLFWPPE